MPGNSSSPASVHRGTGSSPAATGYDRPSPGRSGPSPAAGDSGRGVRESIRDTVSDALDRVSDALAGAGGGYDGPPGQSRGPAGSEAPPSGGSPGQSRGPAGADAPSTEGMSGQAVGGERPQGRPDRPAGGGYAAGSDRERSEQESRDARDRNIGGGGGAPDQNPGAGPGQQAESPAGLGDGGSDSSDRGGSSRSAEASRDSLPEKRELPLDLSGGAGDRDQAGRNGARAGGKPGGGLAYELVWGGGRGNGPELVRWRVGRDQPPATEPHSQRPPDSLFKANGVAVASPLPGAAPIRMPDIPAPLDAAKSIARRHPMLAAVLGAYGLATAGAAMVERELSDIAEEFGLNLDTKAGRSAATELLRARPQDGDWQRMMGEAAAILELIDPGLAGRSRRDPEAARKWNEFMSRAMTAIEEGRLRPDGDGFSGDWQEGMSILTEEERRLLEDSPGFSHNTPRREDLILDDPMQEIGVPNHTGGVPEEVVKDRGVLADPTPEVSRTNIVTSDAQHAKIEEILASAERITDPPRGGRQYVKSGGFDEANKDFDSLGPKNVKDIQLQGGGTGRVGELSDGRNVAVRSSSTGRLGQNNGPATLEIQDGRKSTKVRYPE